MYIKSSLIFALLLISCKCGESLAAKVNQCNPGSDLVHEGNLNETCSIESTEQVVQHGVYKRIVDCPKPCAQKHFQYLRCGYLSNGMPIVCCPLEKSHRSISALKCEEYKELACDIVYATNTITGNSSPAKMSNCAFTTVPLVVGGTEAVPKEFPHMALIGYKPDDTIIWGAGGTLISNQYVLTAAHTFDTRDGPAQYVRLGEHKLNQTDDGTTIDIKIMLTIPYPNYRRSQTYDDIGLLKLESEVPFTGAIRPACLPEHSITSQKAIATGWGITETKQKSNVLMKVILELFSQDECVRDYTRGLNYREGIKSTQVCAGSSVAVNNTCKGDSGGPLQIYHETHFCTYTIIGITSFGIECGDAQSSGVYTRVFPYLSWIEDIVWPN